MTNFKRGDLAITVNTRAPIVNDNHVVRIVRVVGAVPRIKMEFGYEIERLDGECFALVADPITSLPRPGGKRTLAHHRQLRRLMEATPKIQSQEKEVEVATA